MKKLGWRFSIFLLLCLLLMLPTQVNAESKAVALIGSKIYTSLPKAIKAVKNGQTIVIVTDIITDDEVVIQKKNIKFTIDFSAKSYSYQGNKSAFKLVEGDVTIEHGYIKSNNYVFNVGRGTKCTVKNSSGGYYGYWYNKGNLLIKNGSFTTKGAKSSSKDELIQNYGVLTIDNGKFTGISDNAVINNYKLTIKNGIFKSYARTKEKTMYPALMNQKGTCVIYNGVFDGVECSVYNIGTTTIKNGKFMANKKCTIVNEGKMNISGGTYSQTADDYYLVANLGELNISKGSFVGVIGNDSKLGKNNLLISGGTFSNNKNCVIYNLRGLTTVKGGNFTTSKNNPIVNKEDAVIKVSGGVIRCTGYYYALNNFGKAYLTGGSFVTKNSSDSIHCHNGSVLHKNSNVKYTGKIVFE